MNFSGQCGRHPACQELSLGYLKRRIAKRAWGTAIRRKDLTVAIDIFEVFVTSPFKQATTQSFYEMAQFYGRFEPNAGISLEFLFWLQRALYDCEYFTGVELDALHDSAIRLYADARPKVFMSIRGARLSSPIESVMSTMSARMPLISLLPQK